MTTARGPERYGSGYRVGDRWVLTSAHLIGDARETAVRFVGSTRTAPARVALTSDAAGVALLKLPDAMSNRCAPPTYGAVPLTAAPLPFTAGPTCRAEGVISVPPDDRGDTLVLDVKPQDGELPRQALTGAAVWHEDRLIGVVTGHRRADAPHRLAAVRVDRWYGLLSPAELALLHTHAGLPASQAGLARTDPPGQDGPPGLAHLPERLPPRELDGLVTALTEIPSVSDRDGLALILDSIDPVISAMSPRSPALRPDVFNILRTCLRYRGTLDQLLEAIRWVEGDSTGVARMDQEAMELSRRHR
ncbi:effector-associated domain 2-containing protein [Streptomyces sp. NPDC003832]